MAFAVSLPSTALAQPTVTNGLLQEGFYMGYLTSSNRSSLAFYEPAGNNKYNFVILNLKDFSQRRMEAFDARALLTPDHKAQYWVQVLNSSNRDSTQPNFKLHYSPDETLANKNIYESGWMYGRWKGRYT